MSKVITLVNPYPKEHELLLSINDVRAVSGCENYSDEQALAVAETLVTFATVIVNNLFKNGTFLDSQKTDQINQQRIAA